MARRGLERYPPSVLDLPQWAHELATLSTLALAAGYLALHLARIARPRQANPSCSRCEHNPAQATPVSARRSPRLRVLP